MVWEADDGRASVCRLVAQLLQLLRRIDDGMICAPQGTAARPLLR